MRRFSGNDPRLQEFFRQQQAPEANQPRRRMRTPDRVQQDCGVAINMSGPILTNSHVANGADEVVLRARGRPRVHRHPTP
ncbi:hypothetical protein CA12_27360 [Alienimonas californiensis]|uniref:Serine protease n=1 Tax=Alienimonas californiensis TaxID=2527989 RepID=A0A517PB90_9PLAN|nr:hypothetical protein CA12_27360 [Alienimonas californiensis]